MRVLALLASLALAGCGGGLWLGVGDGFGDDDPPSVNLAASPSAAHAGDTVRLVAAASDDVAVDRVEFFRLEADGTSSLLGSDAAPPYEVDALMPTTAAARARFFARAVDDARQAADSALVEVALLP